MNDNCEHLPTEGPPAVLGGGHGERVGAGHGERVSRKQEQAIAALLGQPTLSAAAAAIGVSPITLTRWLRQPAFREAYRAARRDAVAQAVAAVQNATGEAVETLRSVMGDSEATAGARVTAARTVLDTAIRGVELDDLVARVDALEGTLREAGQ